MKIYSPPPKKKRINQRPLSQLVSGSKLMIHFLQSVRKATKQSLVKKNMKNLLLPWVFSHKRICHTRYFFNENWEWLILYFLKVEVLKPIYQHQDNTKTSQILWKWYMYQDGVKSIKLLDDKFLLDTEQDQILTEISSTTQIFWAASYNIQYLPAVSYFFPKITRSSF